MPRVSAEALLSELGSQLGMDALTLDENDHCILKIDDGPDLHLEYFEDQDLLVFAAALDPVAEEKRLAAYESLLVGNYLWQGTAGATLSVSPETGAVVVMNKLSLSGIEAGTLQELIMGFDQLCGYWQGILADLPAADAPAGGAEPRQDTMPNQGMIRG